MASACPDLRQSFPQPQVPASDSYECNPTWEEAFQLFNTGEDFWDVYEHCRMYNPVLGHGICNDVVAFKYKCTCEDRAVKRILKNNETKKRSMAQDLYIMRKIGDHTNFMRVFGAFEDDCHLYMVMELGSFTVKHMYTQHFLKQNRRIHPDILNELVREVLDALCHLHHLGIAHQNLKLENIVCKMQNTIIPVALINFDKPEAESHLPDSPLVTNLSYAAPELIRRRIDEMISCKILSTGHGELSGTFGSLKLNDFVSNMKTDVYALGVCVFMLTTGTAPMSNLKDTCQFHGKPDQACFECLNAILCAQQSYEIYTCMKGRYSHFGINISNLITQSLTFEAAQRPTAYELYCRSPFLQTVAQQAIAEGCFRNANAKRQVCQPYSPTPASFPRKPLERNEQRLGGTPIHRVASLLDDLSLQSIPGTCC